MNPIKPHTLFPLFSSIINVQPAIGGPARRLTRLCHDCHIIHDIAAPPKRKQSGHDLLWWRSIMADSDTFVKKKNIYGVRTSDHVKTCTKCMLEQDRETGWGLGSRQSRRGGGGEDERLRRGGSKHRRYYTQRELFK